MRSGSSPFVVGIGGTTRAHSSSERALMASLAAVRAEGFDTEIVSGHALELPMYAPHVAERSPAARHLLDLLRRCDGVIIASPSYHGGMSGLIKNALDYTEDMSRDERVYLDGLAVGLIGCGAGWQGAAQALNTLRGTVHALRGWPTPFGAVLNSAQPLFDAAGRCIDPQVEAQLETVGRQVAGFIRMKAAAECAAAA